MYRLDKYGTLSPSYAECNKNNISIIGKMCLKLFSVFKIIHVEENAGENIKCNNLTLINLCLLYIGPTNEKALTVVLLIIQVNINQNIIIVLCVLNIIILFIFSLFAVCWHLLYVTH